MAIKISGTVVIDDSRNLCNVNNLNATSINAPIAGATTCMVACEAITEGSLVVGNKSHCGGENIQYDPFACNFQGTQMIPCACALSWEGGCESVPYNYAVTTACSSADGCGLHYVISNSSCCGRAETEPCCQCGCGCPAMVGIQHIKMSCSGGMTITNLCNFCTAVGEAAWTCCACNAEVCFFGPTIACHSGGSKVSVIYMEKCNCNAQAYYRWHENFWCYNTSSDAWSLICHCCACWCRTTCCSSANSRGNQIYPYVTPDNCYIMYFFGQSSQVCNGCAQAGVIVHRINGSDCLIDMTLANNSSCLCCAFCCEISGAHYRHTSNMGGIFPFTYGQNGYLLGNFQGFCAGGQNGAFGCCCRGTSDWWFAIKPTGNNTVCVTNMCCACSLTGMNHGRRRCLGENQSGVHCSANEGPACCDCGHYLSRGWDSGDGIKRVKMYWNCVSSGGCFVGGKIGCFCISGSTLCFKGVATTSTCPCCCCCSNIYDKCMPSFMPCAFECADISNECSAVIWCQQTTINPAFSAGDPAMINRGDGFLYHHSKPVCYQCATYRYYGAMETIMGKDKSQGFTVAWYCCECCNFNCCYWSSSCCIVPCSASSSFMLWQYCFINAAATCFTLNCNLAATCISSQHSHPMLVGDIMNSNNCRLERFAEFYNGDMSIVTGPRCTTPTSHCVACWGKLSPGSCYGPTINYHCFLGIAQNTAAAGQTLCVATLGQIDRSSFSCTYFGTACTAADMADCCHNYYFCSGSSRSPFFCMVTGMSAPLSSFSCNNFCNFTGSFVFRPFYDCNTGRIVSQLMSLGAC